MGIVALMGTRIEGEITPGPEEPVTNLPERPL